MIFTYAYSRNGLGQNQISSLVLNFFPLETQHFSFTIYRKSYQHGDTKEDYPKAIRHSLPTSSGKNTEEGEYSDFWIVFESQEGFTKYECSENGKGKREEETNENDVGTGADGQRKRMECSAIIQGHVHEPSGVSIAGSG